MGERVNDSNYNFKHILDKTRKQINAEWWWWLKSMTDANDIRLVSKQKQQQQKRATERDRKKSSSSSLIMTSDEKKILHLNWIFFCKKISNLHTHTNQINSMCVCWLVDEGALSTTTSSLNWTKLKICKVPVKKRQK